MKLINRFFLPIFVLFFANFCHSLLKIDISKGTTSPIPIALVPFSGDSWKSKEVAFDVFEVISNDLSSSGSFSILDKASILEELDVDSVPKFALWRKIRVSSVITGSVSELGEDKFAIKFKMWSPYGEKVVEGMVYEVDRPMWRKVSHKISDKIYERATGFKGYFNTKILFVSEQKKDGLEQPTKKLAVMDQDGENFQTITDGKNMVLFPRFNSAAQKNGAPQKIIYMSYRGKSQQPGIYVLDLLSKYQYLVKNIGGVSFSPRFTTSGNGALMSVADGKSTNIYHLNLLNGETKKLTHCIGCINTSPSCSPDANCSKIAFTSDMSGSRQIYVMDNDGGNVTRVSSEEGAYSAPVFSPVDDSIAFVKVFKGNFYIGVMKSDGTGERLITSSWLDESPSWAPNGRTLIFRRQRPDGRSLIYAIDANGYNERIIKTPFGASGPSWSANID